MAASLGAHEILGLHEVLTCMINDCNTLQLYKGHCKDPQLTQMLDNQLQFGIQSYNSLVSILQQTGKQQAIPYRTVKSTASTQPTYGLSQPEPMTISMLVNELDDRDISSAMLGLHKAGAHGKMMAALECADPILRRALQQASINSSEQAYEVWYYMNQRGYYQVPTMKEVTTQTMIHTYQPVTTPPSTGGTVMGNGNQIVSQNGVSTGTTVHSNQAVGSIMSPNEIPTQSTGYYPGTTTAGSQGGFPSSLGGTLPTQNASSIFSNHDTQTTGHLPHQE
ncbi:spore coat protein [Brevibacillus daliensis]|uniref:spore coat protein n=1 Tax=Brevibacillus daliensis TaxID=2892995 RepID=UPI001E5FC7EA|nr:spore coat protein [Brevibacillus daliensis]